MKVKINNVYLISYILVYLLLSYFVDKSMFGKDSTDGFHSQVAFAFSLLEGSGELFHPLNIVHIMRLIIVLPFYYVYIADLPPILEAIFILIYLYPVYKYLPIVKYEKLQYLLLFTPLLFSYRSVLVMCSISYLFICMYSFKPKYFLFFISALLANLSSGVVLPWILIIIFNYKSFVKRYTKVIPIFILAGVGLLVSGVHKIEHFILNSGKSHDETFFSNNTFYVALMHEQYSRLAVYTFLLFLLYFLLVSRVSVENKRPYGISFLLGALPTLLFEGVGLVSFTFVFVWICLLQFKKRII